VLVWISVVLAVAAGCRRAETALEVFVGSATKPAVEEATALFEKKHGVKVYLHFGGSGKVLSEMKLARRGDVYLPGSSDFMELAKKEGLVVPESERRVVYLVPAINVPRGNPKNIRSLEDLARPGVRVGIARPDSVCVGLYAAEVLERSGLAARIKPNIVTHAESCEKTAQLVAVGAVDAVLGWEVFEHWDPSKLATVLLPPERVPRIGYVPAAVSGFSTRRALAEKFIGFLTDEEGRRVFKKWGYLTTTEEARRLTRPDAPVGGEWKLPAGW